MNSKNFEFNGDWEYQIELPLLAGFQKRNGAYSSISSDKSNEGNFTLEFEDDLSESPDPTVEQYNTLNYIFENQEYILNAIIEKTLIELPNILINYDLQNDEEYQNLNKEKILKLIGISLIYIKLISKDSYSYFDISGGCSWDEDHGLNILFHKDRVITFGEIDGGSTYEAEKDNGTYIENRSYEISKTLPIRYVPHPKYNKLKPSQKSANDSYEYYLILNQFNNEFINAIERNEIEINGVCKNLRKTFLETSCWFNNNILVEYFIKNKAQLGEALHQCIVYNNNEVALKKLLENGANVNTQSGNGNTILFEVVNSMEGFYRAKTYYAEIKRLDLITEENKTKFEELKNLVSYLIKKGADPNIRNNYGHNCFDIMRNSDEISRIELNNFLNKCIAEK